MLEFIKSNKKLVVLGVALVLAGAAIAFDVDIGALLDSTKVFVEKIGALISDDAAAAVVSPTAA